MAFLEDLRTKVGEAIDDLTSLEVRTYRGNLTQFVSKSKTNSIDEFLKGESMGAFRLARLTKSELDGDTILFVSDEEGVDPLSDEIAEAHEEAVRSAHEMRRGLVELAAGVVKSAL